MHWSNFSRHFRASLKCFMFNQSCRGRCWNELCMCHGLSLSGMHAAEGSWLGLVMDQTVSDAQKLLQLCETVKNPSPTANVTVLDTNTAVFVVTLTENIEGFFCCSFFNTSAGTPIFWSEVTLHRNVGLMQEVVIEEKEILYLIFWTKACVIVPVYKCVKVTVRWFLLHRNAGNSILV